MNFTTKTAVQLSLKPYLNARLSVAPNMELSLTLQCALYNQSQENSPTVSAIFGNDTTFFKKKTEAISCVFIWIVLWSAFLSMVMHCCFVSNRVFLLYLKIFFPVNGHLENLSARLFCSFGSLAKIISFLLLILVILQFKILSFAKKKLTRPVIFVESACKVSRGNCVDCNAIFLERLFYRWISVDRKAKKN